MHPPVGCDTIRKTCAKAHKREAGNVGKRPTIQMVAELAGVSRGTVDRVLNGRSYVSAPVRQRVLAAIQETGFVSCR